MLIFGGRLANEDTVDVLARYLAGRVVYWVQGMFLIHVDFGVAQRTYVSGLIFLIADVVFI